MTSPAPHTRERSTPDETSGERPARPPADPDGTALHVVEVGAGGEAFGRYVLRHRLACGGMATVYLARMSSAEGFRKWVAVKVIHRHIATDPSFVQMFLNEARLEARLNHPNVCAVFDVGEANGLWYLAMEYLHGEALSTVYRHAWRAGAMPLAIAARIVADAARGLHHAHELVNAQGLNAGLVHRDVSPQNIFVLYDGVAKVVDFGIARSNLYRLEDTQRGYLKGRLAYMAPEQLRREHALDRRADVWGLGVVLWELTLGRKLFQRASVEGTLRAVLEDPIPAPRALREDYPAPLEQIVLRALQRDPATRLPTAEALARALDDALTRPGTAAPSQVADFMHALFTERIAQRNELLRSSDPVPPPAPPPPSVDALDGEIPIVEAAPEDRVAASLPDALDFGPRRHRRLAWCVGAVALVAFAAGGFAFARRASIPARVVASPAAPAPARPRGARSAPPAPPRALVAPAPPVAPPAPVPAPSRRGFHRHGVASTPSSTPSGSGYLNLVAIPSAQVLLDGTSLGYTPLMHRALPAGRHVLHLVPSHGGPTRTTAVVIRPGETEVVSVRWP